jgi:hypothetical protein
LPSLPLPLPEDADDEAVDDPYDSGRLFHGPAYRYLTDWRLGPGGATGILDVAKGRVPVGTLHPGLLDAATHVVPHDELWRWSPAIARGVIGYPICLRSLRIHRPLPAGTRQVAVAAEFAGFDDEDTARPMFDLRLSADGVVLFSMRLVDVLLPTGSFGAASRADRQTFLRDRRPAGGLGMSTTRDGATRLTTADVEACDWLPGTVAELYRLSPAARGRDRLAVIAAKDHVARLVGVHPADVEVDFVDVDGAVDADVAVDAGPEPALATVPGGPPGRFHLSVRRSADRVTVRSIAAATEDQCRQTEETDHVR